MTQIPLIALFLWLPVSSRPRVIIEPESLMLRTTPLDRQRRVCEQHDISSRYCGNFRMPSPSFSWLDRLVRNSTPGPRESFSTRRSKLRHSAWIPSVSTEWGRTDQQDMRQSAKPGEDLYWNQDLGLRNYWKIRATWNLERLIFDPREFTLERESRARHNWMNQELDRARRLYYQWYVQVLEFRRTPTLQRLLKCEELEAALNQLTDGFFSRRLKHGSEP